MARLEAVRDLDEQLDGWCGKPSKSFMTALSLSHEGIVGMTRPAPWCLLANSVQVCRDSSSFVSPDHSQPRKPRNSSRDASLQCQMFSRESLGLEIYIPITVIVFVSSAWFLHDRAWQSHTIGKFSPPVRWGSLDFTVSSFSSSYPPISPMESGHIFHSYIQSPEGTTLIGSSTIINPRVRC